MRFGTKIQLVVVNVRRVKVRGRVIVISHLFVIGRRIKTGSLSGRDVVMRLVIFAIVENIFFNIAGVGAYVGATVRSYTSLAMDPR